MRDLVKTVRVLGRFGPKLPKMAETALVRQSQTPARPHSRWTRHPVLWLVIGVGVGVAVPLLTLH
jgi:ubiquinone biosynthesis protein